MTEIHDDGYEGWATVATEQQTISEQVVLRGYFDPSDGRYHWYGRISAAADWDARQVSGADCSITTDSGTAEGRLSDPDAWGRLRIAGIGRPPFPTDLTAAG